MHAHGNAAGGGGNEVSQETMHRWSISKVHVKKKYSYGAWLHDVYHFSRFSKH